MKKPETNNETLDLISILVNRALNDPNGPEEVTIVLPDECGDTLWDDVLCQETNVDEIKSNTVK